jgi:hypothetical protein
VLLQRFSERQLVAAGGRQREVGSPVPCLQHD